MFFVNRFYFVSLLSQNYNIILNKIETNYLELLRYSNASGHNITIVINLHSA